MKREKPIDCDEEEEDESIIFMPKNLVKNNKPVVSKKSSYKIQQKMDKKQIIDFDHLQIDVDKISTRFWTQF